VVEIPPHFYFPIGAGLTYAIPLAAALRSGIGSLPAPLRVVSIYVAVTLVESCVMTWLSIRSIENLWLIHIFTPVGVFLLLLAFARLQVHELARTMILAMIPLFLITWAFLLVTSDSLADFPVYGRTVSALLIVAVAAYTLLVLSQHALTAVTSQPWFWLTVGLLVYFPYLVMLNPLSSALHGRSEELLFTLYRVNAALMIVSNLFITRAILCQKRQSSGGSSSPRLSPA